MSVEYKKGLIPYGLRNFEMATLEINSSSLAGNPLSDPTVRYNPVLVPKIKKERLPLVLVLAGFTGNGPKYFAPKTFEANFVQTLDNCYSAEEAPAAVYIFADCMTFWGGSQFINSPRAGNYEDYLIKDLLPAVTSHFDVSDDPAQWAVMGGSSGGYGALHLGSAHPDVFGCIAASAPDSLFEASLLSEIYSAAPYLSEKGSLSAVAGELKSGKLLRRRDSHTILNAIGMASCYARPSSSSPWTFFWPIDLQTGEVIQEEWMHWKKKDPVVFLKDRRAALKKSHAIYLDVGTRDQFHLQFGARQMKSVLEGTDLTLTYEEFEGNHFDLALRRPLIWKWLKKQWTPQ